MKKQNLLIITLLTMIVLLRLFVFSPVTVSGRSMEPTLQSGEKGIILKQKNPKRNDIVCFRNNSNSEELFIKRVIGVGGDKVLLDGNAVFVNGNELDEEYLIDYPQNSDYNHLDKNLWEFIVPSDTFFVLGDSRTISLDSRRIGFVPKENVIGVLALSFALNKY